MRIAVLGSRGQLGSAIVHEARQAHEVAAFTRESLDIEDDAAVRRVLEPLRPDTIINCTGFNEVDAAESRPLDALRLNAFAVRSLARVAQATGAALVHYSTDFVFDGTASAPMTEQTPPNPRSAYAASKLLGEWFAADVPVHYVLRVESLFGYGPDGPDKGSVAGIVKALRSGASVRVFSDRTVSATHVEDASKATLALLERRSAPGVYHCVNSGLATWFEVATEAARQLDVEPKLEVITTADVSLPAQRPLFCALSNRKLCGAIGYELPTWQHALQRYLNC